MMERYPDVLNRYWSDFVAPRPLGSPTVISTFAGCGGSSLGYGMAGFHELLAVEWEAHAVECFKTNFKGVPVFHGDIAKLSVEQCISLAGLSGPGELDVFDGSPPCQGFSTVGKRELNDPRNGLFKEYIRLLVGLQPKVFVMENVSGMIKGKMKVMFSKILNSLRECGYVVDARLMTASHHGVPQSRQRVIFIGVRADLKKIPVYPQPKQYIVTTENACFGANPEVPQGLSDLGSMLWRKTGRGKNGTKGMGIKNRYFSSIKLDPSKPAPTITKTNTGRGPSSLMHWREPRCVSIAEAKRLQSFPDKFVLYGSYQDQWARIGNSVPPLLMRDSPNHQGKDTLQMKVLFTGQTSTH